jgi:hypothetical protein
MDEIGRIDCKNDEFIVYWDSEEKTPRIQLEHDFMRLNTECSIRQTLEHVFGVKKNIGDLVVNRTRPGFPHEFAFVGDSTWKKLMESKMHVSFRVYNVDLAV